MYTTVGFKCVNNKNILKYSFIRNEYVANNSLKIKYIFSHHPVYTVV